jgi:hypothetical protein
MMGGGLDARSASTESTMTNQSAESTRSAWMRVPSGRRIDLADPDPQAWDDYDLALRLARTYRWGGESIFPVPLSVAQHSLAVLELRRKRAPVPLSVDAQLLELLHVAEEALLGFDCISSLKPLLGDKLREVSDRLSRAVAVRYRLPTWTPEAFAEHKRADVACAASEALHCAGWSEHEIAHVLGIREPVLDEDPLVGLYGCTPWEPWSTAIAVKRFHTELVRLLQLRQRRHVPELV